MKLVTALVLSAVAVATPAHSADLATRVEPLAPAPVAAPTQWSFGLEANPEWYINDEDPHDAVPGKKSKKPAGGIADYEGKASLSYTFGGGWVVGGAFVATLKKNRDTTGSFIKDTWQYKTEATLGYKYKINAFTLTPGVGLGYTWGFTGINGNVSTSKDNNAAYYLITLAGDWKLNSQWTWNVFNLRYRNAFQYTWITPKVATGVTYAITPVDSVYVSAGYSWKELDKSGQAKTAPFNPNYGSLDADKWNLAVGYKRAF